MFFLEKKVKYICFECEYFQMRIMKNNILYLQQIGCKIIKNHCQSCSQHCAIVLIQPYPEEPMFCDSKPFTLVDIESLDAPHSPVEVDHAHKLEHLHFHVCVVSWVEFRDRADFLKGQFFYQAEARVIIGAIVDCGLIQKISNIIGQVVGTNVVVIDEVHFLFVKEYIQIVEVVMAEPQRVLGFGQQLLRQGNPIAQYCFQVIKEGVVGIRIAFRGLTFSVYFQFLHLLFGEQIVGEGFLDCREGNLMEIADVFECPLQKRKIVKVLLIGMPGIPQKLFNPKSLLGVDDVGGELKVGEMLDHFILCLPVEPIGEDLEYVEWGMVDVDCIGNIGQSTKSLHFDFLAVDTRDVFGHQFSYLSLQHLFYFSITNQLCAQIIIIELVYELLKLQKCNSLNDGFFECFIMKVGQDFGYIKFEGECEEIIILMVTLKL